MTIEEKLISSLNAFDDGIPAFGDYPDVEPEGDKFYVVERIGGEQSLQLSRALLAIQSYALSKAEAAALAEMLLYRLDGFRALSCVTSVRFSSTYHFSDSRKKRSRYQTVAEVRYYEDERK